MGATQKYQHRVRESRNMGGVGVVLLGNTVPQGHICSTRTHTNTNRHGHTYTHCTHARTTHARTTHARTTHARTTHTHHTHAPHTSISHTPYSCWHAGGAHVVYGTHTARTWDSAWKALSACPMCRKMDPRFAQASDRSGSSCSVLEKACSHHQGERQTPPHMPLHTVTHATTHRHTGRLTHHHTSR
jgi:hypothetical protein